jgi:hypothetical protein
VEWVALIDEWRSSGLGLAAFCRERGLNFGTMSGWAYKRTHRRALEEARRAAAVTPARDQVESALAPAFLPVQLAETAWGEGGSGSGVEVVLGSGRRVVLGTGFDAETLRRALAVLEGRPC